MRQGDAARSSQIDLVATSGGGLKLLSGFRSTPRTMTPGGVPSNSRARNLRDAHASIRSRNRSNCSSRWLAGVRRTCSNSSMADALTAQRTSRLPSIMENRSIIGRLRNL
jgi:hypothetical protein